MKVEFKASFARDLKKIKDKSLGAKVKELIEAVEQAQGLQEIEGLRKLRGDASYYRIRMGEYRLGLLIERDTVTFVRFLHRKDIYRYFP